MSHRWPQGSTTPLVACVMGLVCTAGLMSVRSSEVVAPEPSFRSKSAVVVEQPTRASLQVGCVHRDDAIACAMYAPGHRPRFDGEDTPNGPGPNTFVIQDPSWKWPQPGGLGTTATITYSYANLLNGGMSGVTAVQLEAAVEEALAVWAAEAPLNFVEIADSGPPVSDVSYAAGFTPNLRFGHHYFDGPSGVLAHAYYPSSTSSGLPGDVHFDNGENWSIGPGAGTIDFLEVCVHEIGHALGLGHESPPPQAIMNPTYASRYGGLGTAFLFQDDIDGIVTLYITGTGGGGGGCFVERLAQQARKLGLRLPGRLLGSVDSPERLFGELRQFRDRVLMRSPTGRDLITAYYEAGDDVFAAVAQNPLLMAEAMGLMAEFAAHLPKGRGPSADQLRIPASTFERGLAWVERVERLVDEDARERLVFARTAVTESAALQPNGSVVIDCRFRANAMAAAK